MVLSRPSGNYERNPAWQEIHFHAYIFAFCFRVFGRISHSWFLFFFSARKSSRYVSKNPKALLMKVCSNDPLMCDPVFNGCKRTALPPITRECVILYIIKYEIINHLWGKATDALECYTAVLGSNVICEETGGLLNFVRIFRISLPRVDDMVSGDVTYGQIVIVTTLTCNFQPLGLFRTKEVYIYTRGMMKRHRKEQVYSRRGMNRN
jgi:hypothetical protein